MRLLILLSLVVSGVCVLDAQAPAADKPPAAPASKPQAKPAAQPARRTPAAARAGMAITVTDPGGATRPGVTVEVLGASDRSGQTNASGQISFTGLQAGTYRVRFRGEDVIAYERDVTLRANQVADVDVTLHDAPPAKVVTVEAEETPAPAASVANQSGPPGEPQILSIVDLLEKEFVGRQPRRETLLSCSGDLRMTMIQLNEPQPPRVYETADAAYYVLGGEGTVRVGGDDSRLQTNGFVSVPRNTPHAFERRGNRPFVLLATLSGEPCETPK